MRIFWMAVGLALVAVACSDVPANQIEPTPDLTPKPTLDVVATNMPTAATQSATASPVPSVKSLPTLAPSTVPTPSATASPLPTIAPIPTASPTSTRTSTPVPDANPIPKLRPLDLEPAFPKLDPLDGLVALASPDDGTDRVFQVLQPGLIYVHANTADVASAGLFLDIRSRVNDRGNEEGLLGLALDPNFGTNGYFYVYYSAANPRRSVISRFQVDSTDSGIADPSSEVIVLEVSQPFQNHNGGHLAFGPDGLLYIGLGDGGGGGDPGNNGQDISTLLGSILRIDVDAIDQAGAYGIPADNPFVGVTGARPEIWAYGLRNPWRFSFDAATGELWAADVGQNDYEEVDLVVAGGNYGWNVMEGGHCFSRSNCDSSGFASPVAEYGRDSGCSVTGGYVYRGQRVPSLVGAYVYGDFCSGRLWALRHDGNRVTDSISLADTTLRISSFGQDQDNELYVLSVDGRILKFLPGDPN